MTLMKSSRAGLWLRFRDSAWPFLERGVSDVSYAQAQAPPPQAARRQHPQHRLRLAPTIPIQRRPCSKSARPTPATPHGCSPPGALVLMMTIPGLGLFYGGMVRQRTWVTA